MKILIINYECPPVGGGGGVASFQIAKELAKKHQVDYLTTHYKGLKKKEKVDNINIYRVKVINRKELATATFESLVSFPVAAFRLGSELCKKKKYDVINSHFTIPSGTLGVTLSKMFKIPNVLSIHGGDIYDPTKKSSPHRNWVLRKAVEFSLNKSNRVVAQSNNTRNNAKKYYRLKQDIDIIPLGFFPKKFKKKTRKQLGLEDDKFYLMGIGRLVKRKGFTYLVKAVSLLNKKLRNKKVVVLIIGEGPEHDTLKKLAEKLGVENQIKFLGFVSEEEKFQYLFASDLYVLSSIHEGFGIVLQEAMYCGLPIVATNNGGQTDLLKDNENTLFVPIKSALKLADAIHKMIIDENLRVRIAKNNMEEIRKYYVNKISSQYEKIFKKLLK